MTVIGYMCGPRLYKYNGWFFELHNYCGPWPLKKDGELRKRAGRKFYRDIAPFLELKNGERGIYRVGDYGGCMPIFNK